MKTPFDMFLISISVPVVESVVVKVLKLPQPTKRQRFYMFLVNMALLMLYVGFKWGWRSFLTVPPELPMVLLTTVVFIGASWLMINLPYVSREYQSDRTRRL